MLLIFTNALSTFLSLLSVLDLNYTFFFTFFYYSKHPSICCFCADNLNKILNIWCLNNKAAAPLSCEMGVTDAMWSIDYPSWCWQLSLSLLFLSLQLLPCKVLLASVKFCLSIYFPCCCCWKIAADDPLIHVFAQPSPACFIPTWLLQSVNVPIITVLWLGLFTEFVMVSFVIVAATLFPGDARHAVFIKEGLGWRTLRVAACSNINRFVSGENWLNVVWWWLIHKIHPKSFF